jgi:radical SAM superfamily enzyme YgiQ (UPF0313 family)
VPYLISGHPGCTLADMLELALELKKLGLKVEQVQDFTPTPGTLSTCMFYTGINPETGKKMHIPRSDHEKGLQKALLLSHQPDERKKILDALKELGREDAARILFAWRGGERERFSRFTRQPRRTSARPGSAPHSKTRDRKKQI